MKYPGQIRVIGGRLKGRKVPVLSMEALRPTPDRVRETLFNWLQAKLHHARCLDFFAGTGILGFEALSRGAKQVTMVDSARSIMDILNETAHTLEIQKGCELILDDARTWIKDYDGAPYDIIFLDPPFQTTLLEECLALLPDSGILGPETYVYIEYPVEKEPPVLEGFEIKKSKKAGKVCYCLLASH